MIKRRQKEFLIDLAKLFDKYGTQPFEELADLLSSPETVQLWVNFLRESSAAAREAGFGQGDKRKQGPRQTVKSQLERIKSEDPEKHRVLTRFHDSLLSKTVLPKLKDIRNFAQDHDLSVIIAKSREQALSPLVQSMILLNTDIIKEITESLPHSDTESFNNFEEWSKMIMDEKRE